MCKFTFYNIFFFFLINLNYINSSKNRITKRHEIENEMAQTSTNLRFCFMKRVHHMPKLERLW